MAHLMSSSIFSVGIVAGLMTVGLTSHNSALSHANWSGAVQGAAQSHYEARFAHSETVQPHAVAAVGALKYALFGQAAPGAIVGQDGWLFTAEELEVTPGFSANLRASAARVAQTADTLAQRGVQLLPVIVPDKAELYESKLGLSRPSAVQDRLTAFLSLLGARGVPYFNALEPLNAGMAAAEMFMKDDTHWSPEGSRVVAEAIAFALRQFPLERVDVSTTLSGSRAFDGDLLRFVPTGALRPWIGPAQQNISVFETTVPTQGGLFDSPQIDVALVGTSFSAKPDWHFEGFLKQALQADLVNFAEVGGGPFTPMEAFLASDFFQSTPPKVVIWEIPARYLSKDLEQ